MLVNDETVLALRSGDTSAYERVVNEYYSQILYYSKEYLDDEEEAREVTQDTFVALWEGRTPIKDASHLRGYLFSVSKHLSLMRIRKRKSRRGYEDYLLRSHNSRIEKNDPDAVYAFKETEERILRVLEVMPEQRRKVFSMSRQEGLKYAEIAERLGISIKTVEVHMGSALKMFREAFRSREEL
ncbi:DNA-directed RNA polymerase sigma-70 factor [Fulvitalea axinellae]|uniref:DNA-directed RNA polymerase sigma-70 factor n=1 Tax=Fulvitalea axinellae TaxID=1182444 RepID=A0AAU9CKR1_9BACT|nr:DNA-directed RNA polymerase sigma-70 factor [Fulvitalea axinellae]